jgi:hypothetical protein
MLASSIETRCATTHFSEQVLTNSRYFCRLSKKRKLRCGSAPPLPPCESPGPPTGIGMGTTEGAGRAAASEATGATALSKPRSSERGMIDGRATTLRLVVMKLRMRSSVSVVMRPP